MAEKTEKTDNPQQAKRRATLEALKSGMQQLSAEWDAALAGAGMTAAQVVAGVVQAIRNNPKLHDAGAASIMQAVGRAVSLGLDISGATGEAWLVGPFNRYNKELRDKVPTAELWVGVRGALALIQRDASVRAVRPVTVYQGDEFAVDPIDPDRPIRHVPKGESARPVAWYCLVFLTSGAIHYGVCWRNQVADLIEAAKQRLGGGFAASPWSTEPEAMAQVQAIRNAAKWAPRSIANAHRAVLLQHEQQSALGTPDPFADIATLDVTDREMPALEHRPAETVALQAVATMVEVQGNAPQAEAPIDLDIEDGHVRVPTSERGAA